jgi:hypothetical protein
MLREIKRRVKKLERQVGRKRGMPIIIVQPGETVEQAEERHLWEHPEDRERKPIIINCSQAMATEEPSAGPPPRPGQEQPQAPYRGGLYEDDKPLQITR